MKKPTRHAIDAFAGTLSLETAARQLGVSTRELRRRLGLGELPFVQVRGKIRVPKTAVVQRA